MGVRTRTKSYQFHAEVEWTGERMGLLHAAEKASLDVATPPEFKGHPGVWSPEDLFVESVNACLMLTFLNLAERRQLRLRSYESNAIGTLEFEDGSLRFTHIDVFPVITTEEEEDGGAVTDTLRHAEELCLISRSITSEVIVSPTIRRW